MWIWPAVVFSILFICIVAYACIVYKYRRRSRNDYVIRENNQISTQPIVDASPYSPYPHQPGISQIATQPIMVTSPSYHTYPHQTRTISHTSTTNDDPPSYETAQLMPIYRSRK